MKERIFRFGPSKSLFGITSEPGDVVDSKIRPALIFLNAGLINRIGPNRMYVSLARRAADVGHIALRFDFSGSGDNPPRPTTVSLEERARIDTIEAMDELAAAKGINQFVLVGLCSGADDAMRIARCDSRVIGICCIDVATYASFQYDIHRYASRLFRFQSWLDLFTGRSDIWRNFFRNTPHNQPDAVTSTNWNVVGADELTESVRELSARSCGILMVLSGGSSSLFNYRTQWHNRLISIEKNGLLKVLIVEDSDHAFTRLQHRRQLEQELLSWLPELNPD